MDRLPQRNHRSNSSSSKHLNRYQRPRVESRNRSPNVQSSVIPPRKTRRVRSPHASVCGRSRTLEAESTNKPVRSNLHASLYPIRFRLSLSQSTVEQNARSTSRMTTAAAVTTTTPAATPIVMASSSCARSRRKWIVANGLSSAHSARRRASDAVTLSRTFKAFTKAIAVA